MLQKLHITYYAKDSFYGKDVCNTAVDLQDTTAFNVANPEIVISNIRKANNKKSLYTPVRNDDAMMMW